MGKKSRGSVGIDVVASARFVPLMRRGKEHLLRKLFSEKEIAYCQTYTDAAVHFAGTFAAKEAASKALGPKNYPYMELEVVRQKDGAPRIHRNSKGLPVVISISHDAGIAVAVAYCL